MNAFSLRTLIDDILLIVRNNNISESEDLSRSQIATWVLLYKAKYNKLEKDRKDEESDSGFDESYTRELGPLQLEPVKSLDDYILYTRKTVDKIPNLYEEDPANIISVTDQVGQPIQYMHKTRRHYLWYRKYTSMDLTYYYDDGYIYLQGVQDCMNLENIWVKCSVADSNDGSEDEITIPEWMVPDIKRDIFKNELAFMVAMPSDDDNNSTLDGIKPHGPQDTEK